MTIIIKTEGIVKRFFKYFLFAGFTKAIFYAIIANRKALHEKKYARYFRGNTHRKETDMKTHANALLDFIQDSPTAYQAVEALGRILKEHGYTQLQEQDEWVLAPKGAYFVTRNGSSLIAFRLPERPEEVVGYHIAATHADAPCFKLKPIFEQEAAGGCVRWNVEKYGGAIHSSWMDRPLSVAGRVAVSDESGIRMRPVHLKQDMAVIPNVAIHMNRKINEGVPLDPQVDMLPLAGIQGEGEGLLSAVAQELGIRSESIVSHDLFLYARERGSVWGASGEMISAPRLDDLMCTYAALQGFLGTSHPHTLPVLAVFDNEEIGSETRQGAASSFLRDTITRVDESLSKNDSDTQGLYRRIAASMLVSADNAHAVHPNHPEYADKQNAPVVNGGVVIKYNAAQNYATDALSAALFCRMCEDAGVKTQPYTNRSDLRGGSTLGHIAVSDLACMTLDIGLAQLAMHSAYETAGVRDLDSLCRAFGSFYGCSLTPLADGSVRIEK